MNMELLHFYFLQLVAHSVPQGRGKIILGVQEVMTHFI